MRLQDSLAHVGAMVDDSRTVIADLLEDGPYMPAIGGDLAVVRTYLNWCVSRLNTIERTLRAEAVAR